MEGIELGVLEQAPQAELLRSIAENCLADARIQAIWVGGSLAAGRGDSYSDIDFRIAVETPDLESWLEPDWNRYLPILPAGGQMLRFGEHALLHHLVLGDGTIVDFYVQDLIKPNPEPSLVVLACRNEAFRALLDQSILPASPLVRPIEAAALRQFFVDYWITTHKQLKALGRHYDYSAFAGLFMERMALLRAWYMEQIGQDIDARMSIHMLGHLHKGLRGKLSAEQVAIVGMPSRTPAESAAVIEAIRAEMARIGQALAKQHAFDYPSELEAVVLRTWNEQRDQALVR
jgi:hypothetical protein